MAVVLLDFASSFLSLRDVILTSKAVDFVLFLDITGETLDDESFLGLLCFGDTLAASRFGLCAIGINASFAVARIPAESILPLARSLCRKRNLFTRPAGGVSDRFCGYTE